MNYIKIYDQFIILCQQTIPRDRMLKRNINDYRKNSDYLYTEKHHIIPKSLGGSDDITNLIVLLPEEHLFIHHLRYKIFDTRTDLLAFRFCLNGYNNKKTFKSSDYKTLSKKVLSGYSKLKQESSNFRINHGWQTVDGKTRISNARKNKLPVKVKLTGIQIGNVSSDHPNVISGIWVHSTKGRKASDEERKQMSDTRKGSLNSNANVITDQEIIEIISNLSYALGYIPTFQYVIRYCKDNNINMIKGICTRFNRLGQKELYKQLIEITGLTYNPRKLSEETKLKIKETLLKRKINDHN